jgi:hypothetical protein
MAERLLECPIEEMQREADPVAISELLWRQVIRY